MTFYLLNKKIKKVLNFYKILQFKEESIEAIYKQD